MSFNEEIKKWNDLFSEDKLSKKYVKKNQNFDEEFINNFYQDLRVSDNSIYGEYGIGYSKINSVIVKKIVDIFIQILDKENNNDYFAISSDGSVVCTNIINNLMKINNKNIKFITFNNYEGFDKSFVLSSIKKINPLGAIHISQSIFNPNILNINLYDYQGIKINNEILVNIIQKIDKNLNDVSIATEENLSFFDNELLIKIFVDKMNKLFDSRVLTKKTKVAISNRSSGITKVLTKLLGTQDFPYVVNNKIKNKTININCKKTISYKYIKRYFWKEILFAKLNKANLLICFNAEGTQLFLFAIEKTKAIYIDPSLLSLIFLNSFFDDLYKNEKKLLDIFIASNGSPHTNMVNLINKYKLHFKQITNNNFLQEEMLLLFWNDYNQYAFGKKINQEFSIYLFLLKILNIIDNYINQYGSINALLNILTKMYGPNDYQNKYLINISYELALAKIHKLFNMTFEFSDQKNKNYENETILLEFNISNEIDFLMKYNFIINQFIIILTHKHNTNILKRGKKFWKINSIIKYMQKKKV